jgi:hypothetical protein
VYFEFTFDGTASGYWHVKTPKMPNGSDISPWGFVTCRPFELGEKLMAEIGVDGKRTKVVFSTFGIVYVEQRIGRQIHRLAGKSVQLLPIEIQSVPEPFLVMNVLDEVACLDESRSKFAKWEPGNAERPDKAGEYRSVYELFVDPRLAAGHDVFRIKGWRVALIVSEKIKDIIEEHDAVAGCSFIPVV